MTHWDIMVIIRKTRMIKEALLAGGGGNRKPAVELSRYPRCIQGNCEIFARGAGYRGMCELF